MPVAQPLRTGDPRRIGGYELGGRLGEGGQGVVYLGTRDEDTYAVKLLHGPVGDEQAAFLREVELAKHVARFCTAQVMDAGFDEDRAYIVSEYVDGPSLAREVMVAGPRRGGALERLAVGTATAITAIHRAGIVHRDLKPQNVLLGPDGPRVIDFGLAKALDAAATVSGRGVGTPAYMAPEQITASAVTGAVDVFSWGATICFAANGSAPFGQDSVAPVLHRILTAEPELGRLDGQLRELVVACLDKDARNRPTSRDLLLALLGESGGAPAEVLRSPPPHILRVPPSVAVPPPMAEPPPGSVPSPRVEPPAVPPPGAEPPAVPLPRIEPPAEPSPRAEPSPLAEPEATGAPAGYRLSDDRSRVGGEVLGSREASRRRVGQALGRAGAAVFGALLVSAAVLVTLLAPALRQDDLPAQGGAQPSVADGRPVETVSPVDGSTPIRTKQSSRLRKAPADDPPPTLLPVNVAVPPLEGLSRAAALKAIRRAGLAAGAVSEADSAEKIGQVLGSSPGTGISVPKGTMVALRVSAGLPVPALVGLQRKAAEAALTSAGLAVGPISRTCATDPDGRVLSSAPKSGKRVSGGTQVALHVARHGVAVPSVVGQSRAGARGALRAAGFAVTVRRQVVEDQAQVDLAIAQSVPPGGCAGPGTPVVITVGTPADSTQDPDDPSTTPTFTPEPPETP
ncbi:protein kinase domain-containing protein [Nonomuraea glycinis]|uniref:protein kinase domain-containing protein n=1 Tax=Nonomuraea glycinis TaxID=2047744 RepID=UPI0033B1C84D